MTMFDVSFSRRGHAAPWRNGECSQPWREGSIKFLKQPWAVQYAARRAGGVRSLYGGPGTRGADRWTAPAPSSAGNVERSPRRDRELMSALAVLASSARAANARTP